MLLVYATLPDADIVGGTNILSLLAEKVAGRWLRVVVVIDAMLVLAGGVLAGIFTLCGLLERLARSASATSKVPDIFLTYHNARCRDQVIPTIFLSKFSATNAPYAALVVFVALTISLYATCAFSLSTTSRLFSLSFLFIMGLVSVLSSVPLS